MYNRNINRLTAVIQSPIAPRSTNVLWDDLVSNTLKVYRKGIWTVIGGAGGGGEGSSLYWGYDETQGVIFPLEQRSVQINGSLTVNGDITARKLSVAELEIDGKSFASYWELDSNTNTLSTTYQVLIKNSLVVEQDTSSGGEGQDTPGGSGGVSEEDVLDILEKNNYITSAALSSYYTKSQSDARYLAQSGGTISGDTDALKIVRNTNGYSAITYYNTQNGATTLLGVMGFDSNGEPSAYRASDNAWRTLIHSGNIGSQSVGYATNAGQLGGYDASVYPSFENHGTIIGFNLRSNYNSLGQGDGHIEFYDGDWYNSMWGKVTAVNGFVGNLTGNASSATKLATPRSIWGQSFDGTGDVLAMNGVGLMSSKGNYYGLSILPTGSPYWGVRTFLTYDEGSTMGAYEIASRNSYGLTISHAGGVAYDFGNIPSNLSYTALVNIMPNGNVGIGIISPSAKLHVDGQINISGGTYNNYSFIRSENYASNQSLLRIGVCYGYGVEATAITIRYGVTSVTGDLIVSGDVASA